MERQRYVVKTERESARERIKKLIITLYDF